MSNRLATSLKLMSLGLLAASALCAAGAPAAQAGQLRAEVTQSLRKGAPHVANEVLVQFRPGVTSARKSFVLQRARATMKNVLVSASQASGRSAARGELAVARLPRGLTVAQALGNLALDPDVEFAEPNWIYRHQATSNDPSFTNGSLWGMYGSTTAPANSYGSGAASAWTNNKTDCSSVYVGIVDEGYMYTHPDLAANAATNPLEIAGNRKDDDGNGLIDDVYGWDFAGNNNTVFDGAADDHGTHVAGTIGAVGGNGVGVAGVGWKVKLLNAKFLGSTGGTLANAVKAVDYFTNLKTRQGINIVATNNSWGGGGFSQALEDAIRRANAANILFVAAAGNSTNNNDVTASYPSSYNVDNVIAVAAITNTGGLASFSSYGATSVDIGAPGAGILSTVPVRSSRKVVAGYATYNGTSMATPHVTGAAALYAALNPGKTAAEIKQAILSRAVPTDSLLGKTATNGRLNVSGF